MKTRNISMLAEPARRGFSLIELLIVLILSVLLFGMVYLVISRALAETQKGRWLQQAAGELRNATRELSELFKKTSYPTTIQHMNGHDEVISYKEWREYDAAGRLRAMQVKGDDSGMDFHMLTGETFPEAKAVLVMLFPVCYPETGNEAGRIIWNQVWLEPESYYGPEMPFGRLRLEQREDTYRSLGKPRRVYDLKLGFSERLPVKSSRIVAHDVRSVTIDRCLVEELRGISVAKKQSSGSVHSHVRRRHIVSLEIHTRFPKDAKVSLDDQCTMVNNMEAAELGARFSLEVLRIQSSQALNGEGTIARSATIRFNGKTLEVVPQQRVSGLFEVSSIFPEGVNICFPPSLRTRTFYLGE
jgi:prepilin-type N-terminal cleavage/methylation domain-containing protein